MILVEYSQIFANDLKTKNRIFNAIRIIVKKPILN